MKPKRVLCIDNLEHIKSIVKESYSIRHCILSLGLIAAGGNYASFKKFIIKYNIDITHFTGKLWSKGRILSDHKPLVEYLVKHSPLISHKLRIRLIKEGLKLPKCEMCGLELWNGKPIPLEIDHINGIHDDSRIENIRIVCPNCHAQTITYRGKNKNNGIRIVKKRQPIKIHIVNNCIDCGKVISKSSIRCKSCASKERNIRKFEVLKEELYTLVWIKKLPFTAIAKQFGVSDNAIRKRCKLLGIEIRNGYPKK